MSGYLVIDLETTGFSPARHDRVVEVGLVQVDELGAIENHWCTLVNPERDMGATAVHGIAAADVVSAPTFRQIAPRILASAAGRAVVAHNARFDLSFLAAELARAGFPLDTANPPYLCTMEWSTRYLGGTSRKLADCCRSAGVTHDCGHSADGDAKATAALLAYYLREARGNPPWQAVLTEAADYRWPADAGDCAPAGLAPRKSTPDAPESWLDQVTSKVARVADPLVESYVDVLERALLDGFLSQHEKNDLVALAEGLGLDRTELDRVHRVYLSALACAAWADGVISMDEQFQLSQVAGSLGISQRDAKQILLDAQGSAAPFDLPALELSPGDRIVFTGELGSPREDWISRIHALGLKHGAVTKSTRAVVAADPDSLSGKAAKARSYGVPIVTEMAFETIVEEMERRRAARSQALQG